MLRQKACTVKQMLCNVSAMLHSVAPRDGPVKARIAAAARILGWDHSRTFNIWYGRQRRVDAHEMDRLRKEYDAIQAKIARVLVALKDAFPGESREDIARLGGLAGRTRVVAHSEDEEG